MAAHIAHSGLAMFRMDKMSRTQPVNALVAHALTRCAELGSHRNLIDGSFGGSVRRHARKALIINAYWRRR